MQVDGFVVVDKPEGLTSYDVIRFLKRNWGIRKAGHLGILDPFATGVLPVAIGKGTRLIPFLEKKDCKDYIARIRLGISTTTDDLLGDVVREVDLSKRDVSLEHIKLVLKRFKGKIEQLPPSYSSVKRGGVRAYRMARKGEKVELKPRKVEIFELDLLGYSKPFLDIRVLCSRGTYVRSLARDIGEALGVGGHLVGLRRVRSGVFTEDEAHSLQELIEFDPALVIPPDEALRNYKMLKLEEKGRELFLLGSPVSMGDVKDADLRLEEGEMVRLYSEDGVFLGLGEVDMNISRYGKKYQGEPWVIKPVRVMV